MSLKHIFNANIVDPDQTPRHAASDLGVNCLPMSLLCDSMLKWVNQECNHALTHYKLIHNGFYTCILHCHLDSIVGRICQNARSLTLRLKHFTYTYTHTRLLILHKVYSTHKNNELVPSIVSYRMWKWSFFGTTLKFCKRPCYEPVEFKCGWIVEEGKIVA